MVEGGGAVGPAVVVDEAQIGEKSQTDRLQTSLVRKRQSVGFNLQRHREVSGEVSRPAECQGRGEPTDEAEDVADEVGWVLLRPTGPEPQEGLDVRLQPLQLVFRQILEMILQLVHGQQLAVRRQTLVSVPAPQQPAGQTAGRGSPTNSG